MQFHGPLVPAVLERRYKRFLTDMRLPNGETVTAHCPNPGAMTGLADAGLACWLARSKPGAKLDYGWKIAMMPSGAAVLIDTGAANAIVAEALADGLIPELAAYPEIRPEARLGLDSRIDFCLTGPQGRLWLEVKSVSLGRGNIGAFPDSKTARGAKHLAELTAACHAGDRAMMLYLLVRDDCEAVAIADDIDPAYAKAFQTAREAGVEMRALGVTIDPEIGVTPRGLLPMLGLYRDIAPAGK